MSLIRFTLIQFPTSYALSNFISDYTLRPSISTYNVQHGAVVTPWLLHT